ncbi:MAG: glycoside hydrolase family 1 protein [Actinobacteria bacterium]|nr:MAG: glycoside hydrolase family 1 protein [Actinomycetota bacterium]
MTSISASKRLWPKGFIWGTGASSTQCEGAAPQSDWYAWERAGNAPISADGNGFATRYAQDFEILASLGLTHHRLSIEWARIEPQQGLRDQSAIDHYRKILTTARELDIKIWVCLHHFSLPNWFANLGEFLVEENRTKYWLEHVDFIAETFGDLVVGWQPVNETNYYATAAYMAHGWPPGHNNVEEWLTVSQQIQLATAEAAVRLKQTGKPVVSIFGLSTLELLDAKPSTHKFAERFYDANWNAGIKLFRDGILQIGDRKPVSRPDLAGCFDMFGFSYYSAHGVRNGKIVAYPETEQVSPLGYAIWPDGLALVLKKLHQELPNTPLIVAEYGIGTGDDNERSKYLRAGLDVVQKAITQGIDIRGFFHWTAVDNYEWLHGYDLQFGIIDADRSIKPSSELLRQEAKTS